MWSPSVSSREVEEFCGNEAFNHAAAGDDAGGDNWVVGLMVLEVMVISLSLAILITMLGDEVPALNWIVCTG
jgi:hypothetical protein